MMIHLWSIITPAAQGKRGGAADRAARSRDLAISRGAELAPAPMYAMHPY